VLVLTIDGQSAADVVVPLQARGIDVAVTRDVASALAALGDADLIVLDAADTAALIMLCRRVIDEAGSSHAPVLAIAHGNEVEERVQILEAGADDVLARPIDERELSAIIEALALRGSAGRQSAAPTQPPPKPQSEPGRVIVFAAAKGGSGATTLAVNTALLLAEMAPSNVAIADMDMAHGQVATHLDIYGRSSTADLAREDSTVLTPELLQQTGRAHASGLVVFGAPYRPDEAQDVDGDALSTVVHALRGQFGTVVVDAGSTLDMRSLPLIGRADRVVMVVTPDIPSLRLLHSALQVMSDAGVVDDRMVFVVNHIYPRATIGPEQIEEHLGLKIGMSIPYDGELFVKAVNEGQPVVASARRGPPALAIKGLADSLADGSAPPEIEAPQRRRRRLGGLLNRS
jgi:pilus assembly protein CpaE